MIYAVTVTGQSYPIKIRAASENAAMIAVNEAFSARARNQHAISAVKA